MMMTVGTRHTDPKWYAEAAIVQTEAIAKRYNFAGGTTGKYVYGFRVQVKGAEVGDLIGVELESDGTITDAEDPEYRGPEGNVVRSFGAAHAPQGRAAGEWGEFDVTFLSGKQMLRGLRLAFVYTAASAAQRDVLLDWKVHE